jgi:hypothetical protein
MLEILPFRRFRKVKNGMVPCKHLERRMGIPYFETQVMAESPLMKKQIDFIDLNPRVILVMTFALVALSLSACSKSNNLLLGRVEAKVGTHTIVVTDCYRTSVPSVQSFKDSADSSLSYRFTPCADADVVLRDERLSVNGISYETLASGDTVVVDHGQVLVNTHIARRAAATR